MTKTMILKIDNLGKQEFADLSVFLSNEKNNVEGPNGKLFFREVKFGTDNIPIVPFARLVSAKQHGQYQIETDVVVEIKLYIMLESGTLYAVPRKYLDALLSAMDLLPVTP